MPKQTTLNCIYEKNDRNPHKTESVALVARCQYKKEQTGATQVSRPFAPYVRRYMVVFYWVGVCPPPYRILLIVSGSSFFLHILLAMTDSRITFAKPDCDLIFTLRHFFSKVCCLGNIFVILGFFPIRLLSTLVSVKLQGKYFVRANFPLAVAILLW
jgi:hypothetical protein